MKKNIIIIILVFISSCGTRKRSVGIQRVNIERLEEAIIKLENNISSNVKTTKVSNRIILEPIDPDKDSYYNNDKFKNTKITIDSSKTDSLSTTIDKTKSESKTSSSTKVDSKQKDIDLKTKKPNPWLWLALVIVVCLIIFLAYKKLNSPQS